ncbi:hypothetical protein SLEP1_g31165 [Rubroshorea leprosula]|uniref:Uncharacterized protein n=1 Tax=Rubroshorea leprosula TaxID=152421 RepID=A0AAV5KB42_9ROSI|nr:hypothetical protein SLEP1_g31165 [Rubroshorea leprosula]
MADSRTVASRSRALTQVAVTLKPISFIISSPSTRALLPCASRFVTVLGSMDSLVPLHSAIASARLISNIAIDSSYWSCLSQGGQRLEG